MGAQPTKVQSTLAVLRGTPVEVYSKSESRWIEAVIGAPKDVREPPPQSTAVLVLFKEVVGGRTDAYKWIKAEEISEYIRARPESKRQAGMMDSVIDTNFGTMFENRSAFEQRGAQLQQHGAPMTSMAASMGPMGSIPVERPQEQLGVMSTIMASVGIGQAPSAMASMTSTIDQNASRLEHRMGGNPMEPIREERPGFMSTLMGSSAQPRQFDPNVHVMGSQAGSIMGSQVGSAMASQNGSMASMQRGGTEPQGVMASIMGMGGSLPASLMGSQPVSVMGSHNGSVAASMVDTAHYNGGLQRDYNENRSPNRSPMGSANGKTQAPAYNPFTSMMSCFASAQPDPQPASAPALQTRIGVY